MYAGVDKYGGGLAGEGTSAPGNAPGVSLEDAIETAAAEETVVVDVPYEYYEDDEDPASLVQGSSKVLLQAQLNPAAGGLMWIEPEDSRESTYNQVMAMSQMTSMLRDNDRNECYSRALHKAISAFIETHERKPIVLDIGTGTGLLSMLAARHGAEHVYACEMFEPMAQVATKVTKHNFPDDRITVFPCKSTDLVVGDDPNAHLPQRADMLVSELFDSALLGEAVLPTLRHAKEHLLVENAVIVPEHANVFVQVVENETLYRLNAAADLELNDKHVRLARDMNVDNKDVTACTGGRPAIPLHIAAFHDSTKLLTEPAKILSFDFTKKNEQERSARTSRHTMLTTTDGTAHAVLVWWEVVFDKEHEIVYSTRAHAQNWQDHWVQVVCPLASSISVSSNDSLMLQSTHDDIRLWFDLAHSDTKNSRESPLMCTCGLHLVSNPERISMLTNSDRRQKFDSAISDAVQSLRARGSGTPISCLDVSDGSLCSLLAASRGVEHVTSIESKDVSARVYDQILQANGFSEQCEVLHAGCQGLVLDHLHTSKPVDLLVAEPFYYSMQNLPLWQALNFWLRRSAVDHLLSPDATVLPASARVCAQAVEFTHLQKCFGAVGQVCGFDHSSFDIFQEEYYNRNFPFPVYMYEHEAVSDVIELGRWNFTDKAHSVQNQVTSPLPPTANGVVVWVEYSLDKDGTHVIATGPAVVHAKQLVRFLPPSKVDKLESSFAFNAAEGTIHVDFKTQ